MVENRGMGTRWNSWIKKGLGVLVTAFFLTGGKAQATPLSDPGTGEEVERKTVPLTVSFGSITPIGLSSNGQTPVIRVKVEGQCYSRDLIKNHAEKVNEHWALIQSCKDGYAYYCKDANFTSVDEAPIASGTSVRVPLSPRPILVEFEGKPNVYECFTPKRQVFMWHLFKENGSEEPYVDYTKIYALENSAPGSRASPLNLEDPECSISPEKVSIEVGLYTKRLQEGGAESSWAKEDQWEIEARFVYHVKGENGVEYYSPYFRQGARKPPTCIDSKNHEVFWWNKAFGDVPDYRYRQCRFDSFMRRRTRFSNGSPVVQIVPRDPRRLSPQKPSRVKRPPHAKGKEREESKNPSQGPKCPVHSFCKETHGEKYKDDSGEDYTHLLNEITEKTGLKTEASFQTPWLQMLSCRADMLPKDCVKFQLTFPKNWQDKGLIIRLSRGSFEDEKFSLNRFYKEGIKSQNSFSLSNEKWASLYKAFASGDIYWSISLPTQERDYCEIPFEAQIPMEARKVYFHFRERKESQELGLRDIVACVPEPSDFPPSSSGAQDPQGKGTYFDPAAMDSLLLVEKKPPSVRQQEAPSRFVTPPDSSPDSSQTHVRLSAFFQNDPWGRCLLSEGKQYSVSLCLENLQEMFYWPFSYKGEEEKGISKFSNGVRVALSDTFFARKDWRQYNGIYALTLREGYVKGDKELFSGTISSFKGGGITQDTLSLRLVFQKGSSESFLASFTCRNQSASKKSQ